MARVSTYLNFPRSTEEAFTFSKVEMPLQEMFWGGYYGSLADRYGIRWMFNCTSKA